MEYVLDLGIEELEVLDVPGFWSWLAGVGAGTVAGLGIVALGIYIT